MSGARYACTAASLRRWRERALRWSPRYAVGVCVVGVLVQSHDPRSCRVCVGGGGRSSAEWLRPLHQGQTSRRRCATRSTRCHIWRCARALSGGRRSEIHDAGRGFGRRQVSVAGAHASALCCASLHFWQRQRPVLGAAEDIRNGATEVSGRARQGEGIVASRRYDEVAAVTRARLCSRVTALGGGWRRSICWRRAASQL